MVKVQPGDIGYDAFVYHDEPGEASTDWRNMTGPFATRDEALSAIRAALDAYWNGGGSIHRGTVVEGPDGSLDLDPEYDVTAYVSPDGIPDPSEWPMLEPVKA